MKKNKRMHITMTPEAREMLRLLAEESTRSQNSQVEYLIRKEWGNRPLALDTESEVQSD